MSMFNLSGSHKTPDGSQTEASMSAEGDCVAYLIGGMLILVGVGVGYFLGRAR